MDDPTTYWFELTRDWSWEALIQRALTLEVTVPATASAEDPIPLRQELAKVLFARDQASRVSLQYIEDNL